MKLIDVSHWQGNIDFTKVKASGIDGVIIKAGGSDAGFYKDSMYETNYANAKAVGLCVGAYYYVGSGCVSSNDGLADAQRFEKMLIGKQFDLPVYIDVEETPTSKKVGTTDATISFCDYLEKKGFYVGIYASDISGFKERLQLDRLNKYTLWVARYGSQPQYATNWNVWQYTSTGKVNGINGNVDMNECNKDFPKEIKSSGLNGYTKTTRIKYRSHLQEIGWQGWKSDGETSGTTGEKRRLEAIQIDFNKEVYAKAHIEKDGWVDYGKITKDTIIGTEHQSKRLECLCLKGDFKYRVHIEGSGWSCWTKADGICTLGSVGQSLRIEAIEII